MANDATYQPGVVQIRQDGDLAVVTGTSITIETGGGLTVESGGAMTFSSGASMRVPVETATTVAASGISPYGLTLINDTAANTYSLPAPAAAGIRKDIVSIIHGATTVTVTLLATGCKYFGGTSSTAGTSSLAITSFAQISLISIGTTSWAVTAVRGSDFAFS